MGSQTREAAALRAEFEAALLAEVERAGPDGVDRDAVVKAFLGRGAGRATIYRWASQIMASSKPGEHLARAVKTAALERAARVANPAEDAAREVVEHLPAVVAVAEVASDSAGGTIDFIGAITECVQNARRVIKHAETADGSVRNAKLLLAASEHLRRSLETATRLQEAWLDISNVQRFHDAIFDVLREESPAFAQKVLVRMRQLHVHWLGTINAGSP